MMGHTEQQVNEATVFRLLTHPVERSRPFLIGGPTFGEVYAMASWLRMAMAERGNRGPLCLATENRAMMAAALLASLAGGPVLLLPYSFSKHALASMHEETGYDLVFSDQALALPSGVEVLSPQTLAEDGLLAGGVASPREELLRLYTGGSSGAPRIWSKSGNNLFWEALFLAQHFHVGPADRIVATISPYHIYGLLYSVLLPLVSGASVLADTPSFPEEIRETVARNKATILISVPVHYRALRGKVCLERSLRLAFSSAGPLDPEDNAAFSQNNATGIFEVYGSTETGGIALRNRSRQEEAFTPYDTVHCEVATGRLRIRSSYLSQGLPLDKEGFFVTGDRVVPGKTGGFVLQGRVDHIAKVAGKRVDLEELRTAILAYPGVDDCQVLALPEEGGRGERIVTVVAGLSIEVDGLKKALAAQFEPYALPRNIKIVRQLPMKANGKYDREQMLLSFR